MIRSGGKFMVTYFEEGYKIQTLFGKKVKVEKYLAEGGDSVLYIVEYNDEKRVLKWYKKAGLGGSIDTYYENIKRDVMRGAPSSEFLWPLDITERVSEEFGYIMDFVSSDYYDFSEYMRCNVKFKSFKSVVDVALHIVKAFNCLHNSGYVYREINDNSFLIAPEEGKVIISYSDSICLEGVDSDLMSKPRYTAPEIVFRKAKPDSNSDRYSMSVILYMLFCLSHPLEGKRYLGAALTPSLQEKIYGSEALFMMDSNNQSNGPHPIIHKNAIISWSCLPEYVQDIFQDAFSHKSLQNPKLRPKESDWIVVLTRFRSEIVSCSCGNEVFTQEGKPCRCEACGKMLSVPFRLTFRDYSIPAVKGTRIYRCQVGTCNVTDALMSVALVLKKKDNGILGIKNKSGNVWDVITPKGMTRKVSPNEVIPLKDGITIMCVETEASIKIQAN